MLRTSTVAVLGVLLMGRAPPILAQGQEFERLMTAHERYVSGNFLTLYPLFGHKDAFDQATTKCGSFANEAWAAAVRAGADNGAVLRIMTERHIELERTLCAVIGPDC